MKTFTLTVFVLSFGLAGCAGSGAEGPLGYPTGARGASGDDAYAPRVMTAARADSSHETASRVHATRSEDGFITCAQCRR